MLQITHSPETDKPPMAVYTYNILNNVAVLRCCRDSGRYRHIRRLIRYNDASRQTTVSSPQLLWRVRLPLLLLISRFADATIIPRELSKCSNITLLIWLDHFQNEVHCLTPWIVNASPERFLLHKERYSQFYRLSLYRYGGVPPFYERACPPYTVWTVKLSLCGHYIPTWPL